MRRSKNDVSALGAVDVFALVSTLEVRLNFQLRTTFRLFGSQRLHICV